MKKLLLILLCVPLMFSTCKKENVIDNDTPCSNDIEFGFTAAFQFQHFDQEIGAPSGDTMWSSFGSVDSDAHLSSGYYLFSFFESPFRLIGKWKKWKPVTVIPYDPGTAGVYTPYEMIIDLNKSLDEIQDGEEFIFPSTGNEITFIPNGWYSVYHNEPNSTFTPTDGDPDVISSGTLVFSKEPCLTGKYYEGTLEFITEETVSHPFGKTVTATFRLPY